MKRVIAYTRLSTPGQLQGYGLDYQLEQIRAFAKERSYRITKIFREVHTGRGVNSIKDRPELQKAIAVARKSGWPILASNVDRLSRDADSFCELLEGKDLVIIDTANGEKADKAIMRAQAVRSEREGKVISTETKKALKALKASGKRLGNTKNLSEAQQMGANSNRNRSEVTAREYAPIIARIDPEGKLTKKAIADALNGEGRLTPRGKPWTTGNIRRLLDSIRTVGQSDFHKSDELFGIYA